jgi:hypothetical protein
MYRPWIGRKFGVEMEMNQVTVEHVALTEPSLRAAIQTGLRDAGLPSSRCSRRGAGYYHSDGTTWDVKLDSSCGTQGYSGYEIASPAMELTGSAECDELKQVTTHLAALRPRIDRRCGLHVHVEVADYAVRDLRNFLVLWARYEPFLFELCPPSRRNNPYCFPVRKTTWTGQNGSWWASYERAFGSTTSESQLMASLQTVGGRGAVNTAHFWRSKRIEFRLGAGTVQYEKIVRWVQLLLTMVNRVKATRFPTPQTGDWSVRGFSTQYMAKLLGLAPTKFLAAVDVPEESTRLVSWIEARRQQFQPTGSDAVEEAVSRTAYAQAGVAPLRPASRPVGRPL